MLAVLYPVILFILLSPNILLRLPPGGDKFTVVLVHALLFGIVLHFTSSMTSGYDMLKAQDLMSSDDSSMMMPEKRMKYY